MGARLPVSSNLGTIFCNLDDDTINYDKDKIIIFKTTENLSKKDFFDKIKQKFPSIPQILDEFNIPIYNYLDLNKLFDVISTSTGSCWAVNSYCPIKGIGPNSPADKDYEGGFATALMYKDLGLAVDAAAKTKSNINYGIQTYEKYKQVTENNKGNLDFSNIINE